MSRPALVYWSTVTPVHSTTPTGAAVQAVRDAVRGALLVEGGRATSWQYDARLASADFLTAVERHRVVPVLADHADALRLPDEIATTLRQRRDAGRFAAMTLLREVGRVQVALEGAGVRWLAFKGPALAAQTTGDFTARGAGDVDVLVAPQDVPAAWAALVDAGWRHHEGRPSPSGAWAWRHHLETHYELPMLGEPTVVDLHWSLHPARGVLPDFDTCHARRASVQVGPLTLPTLSVDDAASHTCAHAARDHFRWLRSVVDVHRLLREGHPLDTPMTRAALAVTDDAVGLPAPAPRPPARHAVVARARRAQDSPVAERGTDFPGLGLALAVRHNARGASPVQHARVAWGLVLSPAMGADVPDQHARTAVPRIAARRAHHLTRRLRAWAQR